MKRGVKVKIINRESKYYGKIGTLGEQNVENFPICSVYFNDDFDYFSEDEVMPVE